jgi:TRAP-type C4-dicarboxylate transport system permease large subunit
VPERTRHGYSTRFSLGVVAGSSVLGMLIPPGLLFILKTSEDTYRPRSL